MMDVLTTIGFIVVSGVMIALVRGIVGAVFGDVFASWIGGLLTGTCLVLWLQYMGWWPAPRRRAGD